MENQPVTSPVEQYLIDVTGSSTDPNSQVTEAPQQRLFSRRWFSQGLLGVTVVGGLEKRLDPCPSGCNVQNKSTGGDPAAPTPTPTPNYWQDKFNLFNRILHK